MQRITVDDIAAATGGTLICGNGSKELSEISTDSRALKEDALFVPIAGEKFDGHDYINSACDNGACAVVSAKDIEIMENKAVIRVKDTMKALHDIAMYYKKKYPVKTVSVTGSVGKTTTKDMLYSALAVKYNTLKTNLNHNNEIGVPKTIFRLEKEHECAVIEMGMNHFGEIERLAEMAQPDIAVITNIGMSHIENLGSQEGIFKAKMEVVKNFTDKNTLIVNGDDKFLSTTKGTGSYKVVYYGIHNPENDVYAKDIINKGLKGIEFTAVVDGKEYKAEVTQPGEHNVYNALAAICAGREFGVEIADAIRGIKNCEYTAQRLEVTEIGGMQIINDCYNASPDSIRAALGVLKYADMERKVAILGDVLEMGEYAAKAHYDMGRSVVENGIDLLITAGENAARIAEGAKDCGMENVKVFKTTEEVCEYVKEALKPGDAALIKASHGMHFENIYKTIEETVK